QSSPKDGRDCRADKSARNDAVNRWLNPLATRKSAFTLAEVLITLVIIGIIAAVTVPTLMANYKKKEVSSRLKKFYSTLSNAVRLADIDNPGFIRSTSSARETQNYGNWWKENLGKYMPVEEKDNTTYKVFSASETSAWTPSKLYILNDGTMLYPNNYRYSCSVGFYFDINGEKAPNTKGKDIFLFSIRDYRSGFSSLEPKLKNLLVCPGDVWGCYLTANATRLVSNCGDGMTTYCTTLIFKNGWEIPDDYPLL
ncbi:MAG: type II secretion system GspH family protein, partial [Candidatus Gastranaerophilales bacterium]|nr:type II secretion system GspH family protein [Candidatus Gastranaerophilales bacterium]